MNRRIIATDDAPRSALYSQGVQAGRTIYVSGMAGTDPRTRQPAGTTIREQTRQALRNCDAVLRAAGATLADAVEVQGLLARPEDFSAFNEAYAEFFSVAPPTRSVARLGPELPGILVSVRLTAVIPD